MALYTCMLRASAGIILTSALTSSFLFVHVRMRACALHLEPSWRAQGIARAWIRRCARPCSDLLCGYGVRLGAGICNDEPACALISWREGPIDERYAYLLPPWPRGIICWQVLFSKGTGARSSSQAVFTIFPKVAQARICSRVSVTLVRSSPGCTGLST